jgi:hypothetical protein
MLKIVHCYQLYTIYYDSDLLLGGKLLDRRKLIFRIMYENECDISSFMVENMKVTHIWDILRD